LQKSSFWFWLVPLLFLGIFFFYPLAAILELAVRNTGQGWEILPWPRIGSILGFTAFQAVLSTFLTILLGLPVAFLFGTFDFKGRNAIRILSTLPFILPTVVVAVGFNAVIGPRGFLNLLLMQAFHLAQPPIQILNTLAAILLAHVFYNSAVIIRLVGSAIEQLDPHLEQAGRTLGASPWENFWKVTFPVIKPALASAALVVFLFDFTSFGVILLMGGPQLVTLEVEIYFQTMQLLNLPLAAWLSTIQLVCTMILTILILVGGGGIPIPIKPHPSQPVLRPLKTWQERIFHFLAMALMVILFVLPLISLVFRSFINPDLSASPGNGGLNFTLNFYRELFINRQQSLFYVPPVAALRNSLVYALATSVLALFLGSISSYALLVKNTWAKLINPLIMLPMGTSAVTLGLGYIITFGSIPNARDIYPILIPIAHSLVALPFVVRTIQPGLASIPISIKQAAATLGASSRKILLKVELPLISRTVAVAALFSFAISLGEFGATAFLSRPDIPTLPVAIFRFLSQPGAMNYGQALAMATILMLVCAFVMYLVDRLSIIQQ
jgi:thiamine transport system permease protein